KDEILSIAAKELGEGYITSDLVEECIAQTERYIGKIAYDQRTRKVVGFSISYRLDQEQLAELISPDEKRIPRRLHQARALGVIKSIAVDRQAKGQGIGTELIEKTNHAFRKRGIDTVFTVAWKSGYGINLGGILARLDFEPLIELPNYWTKDSIEQNFLCPVCGKPCSCSAVIYARSTSS
ncbi:MAG: GNAT family N-acetyltransferase, partial [Acholeplasmataceae bacterium]